jgi:hypothetical protein
VAKLTLSRAAGSILPDSFRDECFTHGWNGASPWAVSPALPARDGRNKGDVMNAPEAGETTGVVDAALRRFDSAVEALESAIERRLEVERQEAALAQQLHVLGADRSRLADALDGAQARAERLDSANEEVARRLGSAMETIRAVLAAQER